MYKLLLAIVPVLAMVAALAIFSIQTSARWSGSRGSSFFGHRPVASNLTPIPLPTPSLTPIPTAIPEPIVSASPSAQLSFLGKQTWGAYVGWGPDEGTDFESKVGSPMQNRATFVHWGNENQFPDYLEPGLKANNETLTIFWEAMDYNGPTTDQPDFSLDAILRGDYDSYITSFAGQVKDYGGPVILIPFEEMNGDWYPWSASKNGNSIAKEVQAYRYVHKFFDDVPNVKFGWDVNCTSEPDTTANRISLYYPGSDYVDVIGVNGFNNGDPDQSFDQIFAAPLKTLKAYKKPIYIFSMATVEGPKKAAWIRDALMVQIPRHPEVAGWVWFNENKEKDWRVWSDLTSLAAFKAALALYSI